MPDSTVRAETDRLNRWYRSGCSHGCKSRLGCEQCLADLLSEIADARKIAHRIEDEAAKAQRECERDAARDALRELADSSQTMRGMFDYGWIVRNTERDGDHDYMPRSLRFTQIIERWCSALERALREAPAPEVEKEIVDG